MTNSAEGVEEIEIIVGVAIRLEGETHALPSPFRHHNLISFLVKRGYSKPISGPQGFVTNYKRFVNREIARMIAVDAGQIKGEPHHDRDLFSEDLW
jgi:hypothetical protein